MNTTMCSNVLLKFVLTFTLLVIGWRLFVYISDRPLSQESYYACPVCRAGRTVSSSMMFPVRIRIDENEFSRYYRNNADPRHRHIWLGRGMMRKTRTGDVSAHGVPDTLKLQYNAALAIIKSLPGRKTRKAFFEHLYVPDKSSSEAQKTSEAISKLNDAYWENEHRKDWPSQLCKVGLYPKQAP